MHTPQDVQLEIATANTKNSSSAWVPFKDLLVNSQYFKYGLVLVSPKLISPIKGIENTSSFFIKDREFFFYVPNADSKDTDNNTSKQMPNDKSVKKANYLLSALITFASSKKVQISPFVDEGVVLFNKRHRDEIFLPIVFHNQDKKQQTGIYLYPWISSNKGKFTPSGFTQYVTAGCLFGSSLKGMDQHGLSFELIKHDIKFFREQKIQLIDYNPDTPNPYEQMLFCELEKSCLLINAFSKPDQPKRLLFHLPYYDYVLFGVELFIRGRITFDALDTFFKLIFAKREEYLTKINELCEAHSIEVRIESPFDNLFGSTPKENITKFILGKLNLSSNETSPDIDINTQQEKEKNLVQYCLTQLQQNKFNDEHRQVWQDLLKIDEQSGPITNLEQLFKIANASMVAVGVSGKNPYEVCSLLPLSEKQIQVNYDRYSKEYAKKTSTDSTLYPPVFNATTFEPLLTYSPTTKGLIFYFAHCQGALAELITTKEILKYSYENVGLFSTRGKQKLNQDEEKLDIAKPIELNQILSPSTLAK